MPSSSKSDGVERLARLALVALGRVEDEVGRERLEPRDDARGRAAHLDALDLVPRALERAGDARRWSRGLSNSASSGEPVILRLCVSAMRMFTRALGFPAERVKGPSR